MAELLSALSSYVSLRRAGPCCKGAPEAEVLLRRLATLPALGLEPLAREAGQVLASSAAAGTAGARRAAGGSLSLALLGVKEPPALRAALARGLPELPSAGLLQLCLAALLDASSFSSGDCPATGGLERLDWLWLGRLLSALDGRGMLGLGGPERLFLLLLEVLHSQSASCPGRPEWPPGLPVVVHGGGYAAPPKASWLASAVEEQRLRACLHHVLAAPCGQESRPGGPADARRASAAAPALEALARLRGLALGVLRE